MNAQGKASASDADRRTALGWIGRQLAWERRLQTLRAEPTEHPTGADDALGDHSDLANEVDTAA